MHKPIAKTCLKSSNKAAQNIKDFKLCTQTGAPRPKNPIPHRRQKSAASAPAGDKCPSFATGHRVIFYLTFQCGNTLVSDS